MGQRHSQFGLPNQWDSTQELFQDQGEGGTAAQDEAWARAYAAANPTWTGNSTWKAENGSVSPRASWLDRNGWVFPAGVAAGVFAAPAIGGMFGGGAGTAGAGAASAGTGAASAAGGTAGAAGAGTAGAGGVWGAAARQAAPQLLGTVYASKSQQRAQRDASRMESSSMDKALAYQREQDAYERTRDEERQAYDRSRYTEERDHTRGQFANYLGRLDPYAKVGARAVTGLGASLPTPQSQRPTNGGGMVKIQAPTGEVRDVPEAQAPHFLSLGGKRVG